MSETPERIVARADYDGEIDGQWIDAYAPRPPSFGHYYTEYVRADLFAAVEADRDALDARLRAELAEAKESAKSAWAQWDALQDLLGASKEVGFAFDEVAKLKAELAEARVRVAKLEDRTLTPPDITAAAARVLLAAWPTDTSFDAAFAACATAYHGGDQMQDTMDRTLATVSAALRALAEVKP